MTMSQRIGWRSYVSPLSSLLTSIYGVWNAETTSTTLATSVYSAWNGEGLITPTQLSASMSNAWNTSLDRSIINTGIAGVWNANGNANDSVSTNHGTIIGGVTYGTAKIGSNSFQFNGSTGYVRLPGDSLKFTGDFTVSYWFLQSFNGSTSGFTQIACYNYVGGVNYGWAVGISNVSFNFSIYGASNVTLPSSNRLDGANGTINISNGGWHHVVITRKAGTRSRIYVDGILQGSNTSAVNPVYNATSYSTIGGAQYSTGVGVTIAGNIDAISSWNRELSADEVFSLYNNTSGVESPYSGKGPVLVDSISSLSGYLYGGASFSTGKLGTNALTFDGINDYVQLPNDSMNFTGDFSISAWLYFPTDIQLIGSDSGYILSNWTAITWATNLAGWRFETYGNGIYFTTYNGTSTSVSLGAPGMGLDRSGWRHIAFTRTGTTYKLWLDGGQYTSTSTTMLAPKYQGTIIPKIGRLGDSTMSGWDSYSSAKIKIEAVSVWQRAITADEISALYNSGNGQLYPFSNVSVSSALDSVSTNHGTNVGGVTYTQGVVGTAFQFDGTSKSISLPNDSLNFTGDFSISAWVKIPSAPSSWVAIFANYNYDFISNYGYNLGVNTNRTIGFSVHSAAGTSTVTSTTTLALNTWYHVTIKRDSVAKRSDLYINGVFEVQATNTSITIGYGPRAIQPTIGAIRQNNQGTLSTNSYLNGSVDALTIWNKKVSDDEIVQLYNMGGGIQHPFTTQTIRTPYAVYNGENLNDSVGTNNLTVGAGTVTYTTGKVGNAFTLAAGQLNFPTNSMQFSSSFSYGMWIKYTGSVPQYNQIFTATGNASKYGYYLYKYGTEFYLRFGDGTTVANDSRVTLAVANNITVNTWFHIVVVFNAGSSAQIYKDGQLIGSVNHTMASVLYDTSRPNPIIGNNPGGGTDGPMTGQVDGVTFWNSALTAPEVFTLFNEGTGMEYPYSSTLPAKLPSFTDSVATNHGTSPATSAPTFTTGKFGKAFRFDGVNDHILLPSTALKFTGDFSVSLWVYIPLDSATNQTLIGCLRQPSVWRGWDINIYSNRIYFEAAGATSIKSYAYITSTNIAAWKHVVATFKNGTGGKLYVDNVLRGSFAMTETIVYDSVHTPSIGAMKYAPNTTWYVQNGTKMDAISTWTKELTATEITDLYNSGNGKQYPNY